ncbi:uncharacterized protein JCM6883_002417 [Sporobolomyces salmoneus]|uniref:uncharacterized protein n=1 Tax=Sporobolomyces salmoneus TaxID=183962 RepID=UPI00317F59E3
MPPIRHYSTSANTKVVRRNAVQQNKGPWGSFFPNAVSRRNVQPDTTDRGFGTYEFGGLLATQFEHLESSIKDREVSLVRSDRADYSFCLKNHKSWDNLLFFNNSKKSSEMLNILKIGSDRGLVTVQPFCGRTGVKLFATVTFSVFLSRSDKVNTIIANLQLQRSLDDATHKKALDTFTVMKSLWPSCPTALEPILSAQAPHQIGPFRGMKPYDQVVKLLKKKGFSGEELFAFTEDIEVGKPLVSLLVRALAAN